MRRLLVVAVLAALTLSFGDVRAAPLDAATCGQLKGEQVRMEQGGVRDRMAKGPSWAKANLAADKIDEVRRLIELDEQLLFRCSTRNLVELPAEADADPPPAVPGASEDGKDTASPKANAAAGRPEKTRGEKRAGRTGQISRCKSQTERGCQGGACTPEDGAARKEADAGQGCRRASAREGRCRQAQAEGKGRRRLQGTGSPIPASIRSPTSRRDNKQAWAGGFPWSGLLAARPQLV